ncbi:hypothetical protein [Xenorhabdus szentirmaii]|nr:hypothetical protein [Xenorhabdus szentirmaii]
MKISPSNHLKTLKMLVKNDQYSVLQQAAIYKLSLPRSMPFQDKLNMAIPTVKSVLGLEGFLILLRHSDIISHIEKGIYQEEEIE